MTKTVLYEGPDISYHNGNVNIKSVRDAGCKKVIIRAGYGKNNVDQKYIVNAEACYNLGVPVALYWFSYAYTPEMAKNEADYACNQAAKYWSKCPIAYDFEYESVNYARNNGVNITKALATDMAIAFLKQVKARGYIPVIYTNKDYKQNYFDLNKIESQVGGVRIWYARYTSTLPADELNVADIWQYTSTGRVSGISGNVDMNKFYSEIWDGTDDTVKVDRPSTCNINILDFQKAANADGYTDASGRKLVEDGIDGANTQAARKKIALRATKSGNTYKVCSTGETVRYVQRRCNEILRMNIAEDGKYGADTRNAVFEFQKKFNLKRDGIAGYETIQMMFYN